MTRAPKVPVAALCFAVLLLAGCASPRDGTALAAGGGDAADAAGEPAGAAAGRLRLAGHVLSPSLHPVPDATVTVVGLGAAATTGIDGAFDLGEVERRLYTLTATAAGYLDASATVAPDHEGALRIVLQPGAPVVPYATTVHFRGLMQCAFEALILSPSCDSALVAAGLPPLFDTNQSLPFAADRGWRTLVVDVAFDGEAHPGLDGLRIAVRGSLDPDGGGEYAQYGRWHGPGSFAARLEPGGSYPDGSEPVPANASGFQVDVYPHSHVYHPAEQGLLGVGAARDVEFDLYATLFYVEPAPPGWSFLAASG